MIASCTNASANDARAVRFAVRYGLTVVRVCAVKKTTPTGGGVGGGCALAIETHATRRVRRAPDDGRRSFAAACACAPAHVGERRARSVREDGKRSKRDGSRARARTRIRERDIGATR